MDDFEFDDIADEDLILAESQTGNSQVSKATSLVGGVGKLPQPQPRTINSVLLRKPSESAGGFGLNASRRSARGATNGGFADRSDAVDVEILDLSSSAFDSEPEDQGISKPPAPARQLPKNWAASQSFRQTTLFGRAFQENQPAPTQTLNSRPFRADLPPEPPTHHKLDQEELKTWVYPTNLGPIRDYQFSIVKNGLFHNTLVALPTGMGKTFIAATIMLNFFRWTKDAKIVFVAPTKPLASQQVSACLHIAGIPRSHATLLTGDTCPGLRAEEWKKRRVFFMTPQTLQNDLAKGYADPKSIVLLVVDEAHRSTGEYAYVKAVKFIRRFSQSFRVLALTATPGSSVESVQEVIDNLGISHVEIRTEESIDLRPYTHSRDIERVLLDPSDEMLLIKELFSKALQPLCTKLGTQNVYWGRDPMGITTYQLLLEQRKWCGGIGKHATMGVKGMVLGLFGILQKVAHSIKLLNFHGINPFYQSLADFRKEIEDKGGKGGKYKRQLMDNESFQEMMDMVEKWRKLDGFVSHPKISALCERLLNHFMDAGEDANTRAIVFCEYRHSAEDVVRLLNKQPLIKATVFVGQADSKAGQGMTQKQQIETIERFKKGEFNVLVATSVGEEGLDIGQVDLIVCYDASSSPIRMLQRMGRTGRKRAGNIVLLLMKGSEENKFDKAKGNYEQMQRMIADGSRFTLPYEMSARIVPRDIRPEVDKRDVSIPFENTQDPSLPEPKKRRANAKKKAPKKVFHMPDGVEAGFVKAASFFDRPAGPSVKAPAKRPAPAETDFLADVPDLSKVVLTPAENVQFQRVYKYLPGGDEIQDVGSNLGLYPESQRRLQPTRYLSHGQYTRRTVKLFKKLGNSQDVAERYHKHYGEEDSSDWRSLPRVSFAEDTDREEIGHGVPVLSSPSRKRLRNGFQSEMEDSPRSAPPKKRAAAKRPRKKKAPASRVASMFLDGAEDDGDEDEEEQGSDTLEEYPDSNRVERAAKKPIRPAARRKKGARKGNGLKRRGDHLEELGDDCERTSDIEDTDGSDSGADLADFIADDDEILSSLRASHKSTSPTILTSMPHSSPPPPARQGGHRAKEQAPAPNRNRFFEPVQFPQTQSQETDDFPDLDDLLLQRSSTTKTKVVQNPAASSFTVSDDDGSGKPSASSDEVQQRPAVQRKRAVVYDSDDE